ncbi:MAG TPA: hypothetical protein VKY24_00805 [Reyranella sp.]|nr:hypothetical protein [Reyranella sp.]
MANARKRRARKARRAVNRGDRVKATPETLAKLRPHPLEVLLARGREDGGIDADQLQCAEEIVDAFAAITRGLGIKGAMLERIGGAGHDELSPREERLSVIWFAWAAELPRRLLPRPVVVVELIAAVRPAKSDDIRRLGRALDLWAKVRQDSARPVREVSTIRPNLLDSYQTRLTVSGR